MHFSGDADMETGQKNAREYESAMTRLFNADRTLGMSASGIVHAIPNGSDLEGEKTANSSTRFAVAIGIDVLTWDG